jgi:hypothetical protein
LGSRSRQRCDDVNVIRYAVDAHEFGTLGRGRLWPNKHAFAAARRDPTKARDSWC